jgi:hypothetical protein
MVADSQRCEERPSDAAGDPEESGRQLHPNPEDDPFQIAIDKARRLVAAELDIAHTRSQILESNLKITEAQLELAERQLDQLIAENERLRQENESLKRRLGESV